MDKFLTEKYMVDELYEYGSTQASHPCSDHLPTEGLFFCESGSQSVLVERKDDVLWNRQFLLRETNCWGITGRSAEQKIAINYILDPSIPCVSLIGRAGSGKSLLALATALHMRKDFLKILIARPVVSLNNSHKLGFIPGGLDEKLAPWCAPLMDNLAVLKETGDREAIERMLNEKKIQMLPLETIRGRSFYRSLVIIDEAQNLDIEEIKTIGSRIGEGSKIIFNGDLQQTDRKELRGGKNGLAIMIEKTKHSSLTASIELKRCERSPLADLFSECL